MVLKKIIKMYRPVLIFGRSTSGKVHRHFSKKTSVDATFSSRRYAHGGNPCEPPPPPKISLWRQFLGEKQKPIPTCPPTTKMSDDDICKLKQAKMEWDPDVCQYVEDDAEVHHTAGAAYIIERGELPHENQELSCEDRHIRVMEAHFDQKDIVIDPLPVFTTVEQRLLDLAEKRLHPAYRRYLDLPRKERRLALPERTTYQTWTGQVNPDDLPGHLKFNSELMERKNLFSDYKRVEPPRQLVARLIEMRRNEKPTLQPRVTSDDTVTLEDLAKKQTIFDTLYQRRVRF